MDEQDFARIEQLLTKLSDDFSQKIDNLSEEFGNNLEAQSEDFHRWIGVQGGRLQHKLDLVVEGHQMFAETLERVESTLPLKIDKIAAEVAAHRADTEVHHGIYRVKES
jgi:cytochrome c556